MTHEDLPYSVCNFYVLTQNTLYGDGVIIEAPQAANSAFWLDHGNLRDVWFKNAAPGANTKIVAVATLKEKEK